MPLPDGFLARYRTFLDAVSAEQGLPAEELDKHFTAYPETVVQFLVSSMETGGAPGFTDAYRLIDVLEGLGCHQLTLLHPQEWDPVVLRLQRPDGLILRATFSRAALNLSRPRLVRLAKEETGISRPTELAARVRGRDKEKPRRDLDAPLGPDPKATDPERRSTDVTKGILARRPEGSGPDQDDGLEPANPIKDWPWSKVLGHITDAASAAGCTRLQIGRVGTSGIVRLQATVQGLGKIDCYLAPQMVADRDALVAAITRHIERREARVAEIEAEAQAHDDVPHASVSDTDAIDLATGSSGPPAPTSEISKPLEPRLQTRCAALGYDDASTTLVGNGRYLRIEATNDAGRRLVIACAVESVAHLDDASLDARLTLLFERALDAE